MHGWMMVNGVGMHQSRRYAEALQQTTNWDSFLMLCPNRVYQGQLTASHYCWQVR